jgi:hypothetical protein
MHQIVEDHSHTFLRPAVCGAALETGRVSMWDKGTEWVRRGRRSDLFHRRRPAAKSRSKSCGKVAGT